MDMKNIASRSLPLWIFLILASVSALYYISYRPVALSFAESPRMPALQQSQQEHPAPTAIQIPSLNIEADIEPGYIKNETWTVSDRKANHLATSARPGQAGNIIIYAHDTRPLFSKLPRISPGDTITIINKAGKEYHYRVQETHIVTSDDTSLVQPESTEVLTVYTCTGILRSKRFVARAMPM